MLLSGKTLLLNNVNILNMKREKEEKIAGQAKVEEELNEMIRRVKSKKSALKKMSSAIYANKPKKLNK